MILIVQFNCFSQTIQLSQNSNLYISNSSDDLIYISSLEGLNIYDGFQTKVYRPPNHNMIGKNIQSAFYEDKDNRIWFCTYQALHVYNPSIDSIEYFFLKDSIGNNIKSDYRIIGLYGNQLWVHTSHEIHIWDVNTHRIVDRIDSPARSINYASHDESFGQIILVTSKEVYHCTIDSKGEPEWDLVPVTYCQASHFDVRKEGFYIGNYKGELMFYDPISKSITFTKQIFDQECRQITALSGDSLAIVSSDNIIYYDKKLDRIIGAYNPPYLECVIQKDYRSFNVFDDIVWVSIEGQGVRYHTDISKRRFKHLLQLDDQTYPSITGIYELDDNIVCTTRGSGLIISDKSGTIIKQFLQSEEQDVSFILSGVKESKHTLLLDIASNIYRFDIRDHSLVKLQNKSNYFPELTPSIIKLKESEFLCSTYDTILYMMYVENNTYRYEAIRKLDFNSKTITYVKPIDAHTFIASENEEQLIILSYEADSFQLTNKIDLNGGVLSYYKINDTLGIMGNRAGLYKINILSGHFERVEDDQGLLNQTIYSIYPDNPGYWWCSSNKGILRFDPRSKEGHQFSIEDGTQADEFNSHAHLRLKNGDLLLGGIFGLNHFHPDSINLSEKNAPVIVTKYRVNDEESNMFGVAQVVDEMKLGYENNTIAFHVNALDYTDPQSTKIKYKLIGEDERYIESSSAKAEIRYANLDPGSYTLSLIGANSDGVWNTFEKTIDIFIAPPYWQTWWFRLLAVLSLGSTTFFMFRYYYRQQLARKDFELREQALIIEKQSALQAERTRIAGEMHDDLGGGLTSIRFLSQKMLRGIKNVNQKQELDKIVDYSQALVNNMSEIIWAMNAGFDTLENLISYCRRYAYEYLEPHDIDLKFITQGDFSGIELSGERRRNIFLVIKEALHNIVKHSQADLCKISFSVDEILEIKIFDNGVGLKPGYNQLGNGLINMKERIINLGGDLEYENNEKGLEIKIELPLK